MHSDDPENSHFEWFSNGGQVTPTDRGARRFMELLRKGKVPAGVSEQLSYGDWRHTVPADVLAELVRELAAHPDHRAAALALIDGKVEGDRDFLTAVEATAVDLVTDVDLVRESPNHGYYWHRLAKALLSRHTRSIARALLAAHDPRNRSDIWFIQHSRYAAELLSECINADPQIVWDELVPYLGDKALMALYTVGLPPLLGQMPRAAVLDWIGHEPALRAARVARLIPKDATSEGLFVEVLDRYGDIEAVGHALAAHLYTGQWVGEASKHWDDLAESLEPLAARRDRPRAARWAKKMARGLRERAEEERKREAEESVRDF